VRVAASRAAARLGPGGLERRRAERVPMAPAGGVVSVVGARLVNVSPHGMMIESPVALRSDAILQFRLMVAGTRADVEARVVACAPLHGARRRYGAGLEFSRISPEVRALLAQVLGAPGAAPRPS
jgi:PilZ domain-containing protein